MSSELCSAIQVIELKSDDGSQQYPCVVVGTSHGRLLFIEYDQLEKDFIRQQRQAPSDQVSLHTLVVTVTESIDCPCEIVEMFTEGPNGANLIIVMEQSIVQLSMARLGYQMQVLRRANVVAAITARQAAAELGLKPIVKTTAHPLLDGCWINQVVPVPRDDQRRFMLATDHPFLVLLSRVDDAWDATAVECSHPNLNQNGNMMSAAGTLSGDVIVGTSAGQVAVLSPSGSSFVIEYIWSDTGLAGPVMPVIVERDRDTAWCVQQGPNEIRCTRYDVARREPAEKAAVIIPAPTSRAVSCCPPLMAQSANVRDPTLFCMSYGLSCHNLMLGQEGEVLFRMPEMGKTDDRFRNARGIAVMQTSGVNVPVVLMLRKLHVISGNTVSEHKLELRTGRE